jgi:hypothetical protein
MQDALYQAQSTELLTTQTTTASFPRFKDLPLELRLTIWGFVCPPRRVIWIQQKHEQARLDIVRHWFHYILLWLKSYQLVSLKETETAENSSIKVEDRKCYIDFKNDIIFASYIPTYIPPRFPISHFVVEDVFNALGDCWKQITQIACSHNNLSGVSIHWCESVLKLQKLRKLYLICGQILDRDNRYKDEMVMESATMLRHIIVLLRLHKWLHPIHVDFIILPPFKLEDIGSGFYTKTRNINFGAVKANSGFLE